MIDDIVFPILTISRGTLQIIPNMETFTTATKHAVDIGHFSNLWLVDSSAHAFVVRSCEIVDEPRWRRPRTPFGRGVRLTNFVIEDGGRPPLADVKKLVLEAIERNESQWSAGVTVAGLLADIASTKTIEEIIQLLTA